jgi:hypothetical protein
MSDTDGYTDFTPERRAPRRRVEAIDDLAREPRRPSESLGGQRPAGGRRDRGKQSRQRRGSDPRARGANMPQLKQDLHYGQYLSVPHGSRSIFAGSEQRSRRRSIVITVSVAAAVILVLVMILRMTACSG